MKVDFIRDDYFIIYYVCDYEFRTEEELKLFFKMLNNRLKKRYDYEFTGYYNVNIYACGKIFVMEFENLDDFGRADFNITLILHSNLLYEFSDSDMIKGKKVYYQYKYYVELETVAEDIHLFEYGNIIYGEEANAILNQGILISI